MTSPEPPTKDRNYSPWFQWVSRLMATTRPDPLEVSNLAEFDAWRKRCRSRFLGLLGQLPERVLPNVESLGTVQCEGYRREKIVFDTEDTMSVPAYLLVPDDRSLPGPAILACHGHGPGKDLVCGLATTEAPNGDYAAQLARRGYLVLAPDLRCFGERADWNPPDHYGCDTNLVHAVMAGWNPVTQNLWDLARCLDVLEEHPLVDPKRIAMVGLSLGGTMTLLLSAYDDRVAAAVVSGFLSSWAESHKVPWNMCGSQVMAGMLGQIEHVDLGALIAPRPLLVETGTEDLLFPVASASEAVGQLRAVYQHFGASDRIVHDVFVGDHQWHGLAAYPFLDRWLDHTAPPGT